jgi:hypothetical protein
MARIVLALALNVLFTSVSFYYFTTRVKSRDESIKPN